jgi:uncharacterized membrane protein YoaK (UPF0700 family)
LSGVPEKSGVQLMAALTFVTGMVDAVGYLGLDRVFTGNMTGNIVILGMGAAGADGLPVLGPAIALATFTVGAFAAGMTLRRTPKGWSTRSTVLLGIGGAVLLALTALSLIVGDDPSVPMQVTLAALTALVMGEQAAVARAVAVRDMTTVVVTSTLTSLAGESMVGGGRQALLNRRTAAIVLIFLGAVVGALLLLVHMALAFAMAAIVTIGVSVIGHRLWRRS